MDNEPEVIREQMDETRASLTDKVETLEHQVVQTVQEAACAVQETVATVKEAVHDSVETVRDSVSCTIDNIKEAMNLQRQFDRHPWLLFGSSVLVGFVGGRLLGERETEAYEAEHGTGSASLGNGRAAAGRESIREPAAMRVAAEAETRPSWLGAMIESVRPELNRLRGLAVGTALGVVRDAVAANAPPQLGPKVCEVIDSMTGKLGGEVVAGPIIKKEGSSRPATASDLGRHEADCARAF
jgi:ElaB/YqjD/DUF883 family membrane-anchored ribosome-binding protein